MGAKNVVVTFQKTHLACAPPTIGDYLRSYTCSQFDHAGRALGRCRGDAYKGIREAQEAIRQIRAALDLGRDRLGSWVGPLSIKLGRVSRSFALAREPNAVVDTISWLIRYTRDIKRRALLKHVRKQLIAKQVVMLDAFLKEEQGCKRIRANLKRLREIATSLHWDSVSPESVASAILHSQRRVARVAENARHLDEGPVRDRWQRCLALLEHQLIIVTSELNASFNLDVFMMVPPYPVSALREITDALGFEHELHSLRVAVARASGIRGEDRVQVLGLCHPQSAVRTKPQAAIRN